MITINILVKISSRYSVMSMEYVVVMFSLYQFYVCCDAVGTRTAITDRSKMRKSVLWDDDVRLDDCVTRQTYSCRSLFSRLTNTPSVVGLPLVRPNSLHSWAGRAAERAKFTTECTDGRATSGTISWEDQLRRRRRSGGTASGREEVTDASRYTVVSKYFANWMWRLTYTAQHLTVCRSSSSRHQSLSS